MPDFTRWDTSGAGAIQAAQRAVRAWLRIQRDPLSVQFRRGSGLLPAQTVRVGTASAGAETTSLPGQKVGIQTITVYGVRDHPDSDVADTDMARGDRFMYGDKFYRITGLVEAPGEVQGFGEVDG